MSYRALEAGARRLHLDTMAPRQRERVELVQGSLTYRDRRLEGFDAAAVVEVVEHLDPARLGSFERVLFAHAKPGTVVVTTPNVEYNVRFENVAGGHAPPPRPSLRVDPRRIRDLGRRCRRAPRLRGRDVWHRPRGRRGGPPTQMAVFTR